MPIIFLLGKSFRPNRFGVPPFRADLPLPALDFTIAGYTRDASGNPIPSCNVFLFLTATNVLVATTTSGPDGSYRFGGMAFNNNTTYYIVAYKVGSPDVSGTTVNTLMGT